MGFKSKLYLAISFLLGLMVLFLGIAMFMIGQLDSKMHEVMKNRYEKVRLARSIVQEIRLIESHLETLIIATDSSQTEQILRNIAEHQAELQVARQTYTRMVDNALLAELLPSFSSSQNNFEQLISEMITLTKVGRQAEAANLLQANGQRIIGEAVRVAKTIQETQEGRLVEFLKQSADTGNRVQVLLGACIITCLAIGGVIAVWIVRSITHDLTRLANSISSV